jgi:diguanylate cyclase (GGDEF)-like protein
VYRVITCLATEHDYRLVLLATVVCAISAVASFKIYTHVLGSHGLQRFGLLVLTGVSSGAGVWATHFVAMLAYGPGMPITYEPVVTTASLVIAIVATTVGFGISGGVRGWWPAAGGIVVGVGIGLMHYIGMGALIIPGTALWSPALVGTSFAVGAALAAAATVGYHKLGGRLAEWLGAGMLTLAICGLHFTAMGAVTILPDPAILVPPSRLDNSVMGVAVAGATLLILISSLASTAFIESQKRRLREEELHLQNLRFNTALANMGAGLCMFDAERRLVVSNDRYAQLYQLPPELLKVGTPHDAIIAHRVSHAILKGDSNDGAVRQKIAALARLPADTASRRIEELANGRLVCITREPMPGGGWVARHEDVTELQTLNEQLKTSNKLLDERSSRLQAIIDNFPGGITFLDAGLRVSVVNEQAKKLLELPEHLFAGGPPLLEDIFRFNASRGEYGPGEVEEQVATRMALARAARAHVFERQRPDGTVIEVRGVPLEDGGFVTTYVDMTDRRRSEAKIVHMAHHDALTDLPNRVLLRERLEQALANAQRGKHPLAVLMVDLDRFKEINDTLGHSTGDRLLKVVAERLQSGLREGAIIARLGGDEFAIVDNVANAAVEATAIAERIQTMLSTPFDLGDHQVVVGSSIGIAVAPADGADPDQLLKNADLALYRAKSDGRGTHRFFEPEMNRLMQARRDLEGDLRTALANGEFELYYQPFVNLQSGRIAGCEALLRWHHPRRGMVSPVEFIPLAEETGLITQIGEWVLRNACAEAATWPEDIKIAVNLSPAQFKSMQLAPAVLSALAASGLCARRLELEVTESLMIQDSEATFATLTQLHTLGVGIALDDFGTGYSSLSFLRKYPFDKIKIDRTFVSELSGATADSAAIVRSVVQLAVSMGKATTAEGVETKELLELVRTEGCTEVQGHYISRPKPATAIAELLRTQLDEAASAA